MSEETSNILGLEDYEMRGPVKDFILNSVKLDEVKNNVQSSGIFIQIFKVTI